MSVQSASAVALASSAVSGKTALTCAARGTTHSLARGRCVWERPRHGARAALRGEGRECATANGAPC